MILANYDLNYMNYTAIHVPRIWTVINIYEALVSMTAANFAIKIYLSLESQEKCVVAYLQIGI